jgi:diguanylate cyclase (GGDEF)-like protein/putative nucleotidyltransferase with HDIG domain
MKQIRVLLADDDADHQNLLLLSLVRGRPSVDLAVVSGHKELLAAARRERFDCIVLDYRLPPFTATELIRELVPLQENVPFIVISSCEEQKVVVDLLRNGVADFVPKSEAFNGTVLWQRIEAAVEKARSHIREQRAINRRLQALRRLADTDPLTGLYNRRFIRRMLNSDHHRSDRRRCTAVTLIDIDHFKHVNDVLGHAAGDQALRELASILRARAAPNAVIARWGGEEFLVITQSESLTDAWIAADDLRLTVASEVNIDPPLPRLSISAGVAILPTLELCEDSFAVADHAVYLAKELGRNRVCTHQMVAALDEAQRLQADPRLTPPQRVRSMVASLARSLGKTQLEHVSSHGWSVRDLALRVAISLRATSLEIKDLEIASEFHDIGKIGIPEELLSLARPLNPGERRFINEHARFGAEVLRACGVSKRITDAVRMHHTRFDAVGAAREAGSTPTPASIIAACDAVVTMLSVKPYAMPRTPRQALAELRAERGRQFDPEVVDSLQFVDRAALRAA